MKNIKTKNKNRDKKRVGFFAFLFTIAENIARALKRGPMGYLFADVYNDCNQKWRSGFIYNLFKRRKRKFKERSTIAHIYEQSKTSKKLVSLSHSIIHSNLRIWGVALLFFALSVLITTVLHYSFGTDETAIIRLNVDEIKQGYAIGIVMLILALPLVLSKKELGESLLSFKSTRYIITDVLNLNPNMFEKSATPFDGSYLLAILFSISLGFFTYFVKPIELVNFAILIALFMVIMAFPEIGIVGLIVLLPFANVFPNPSVAVLILLSFAACGFVFKFIRGKRVVKFALIDVLILSFGALILCGGIFSVGGEQSLHSAAVYCAFLLVYFLIVNMYIGKAPLYRAFKVLVITAAIVSAIGILRGRGTEVNEAWADMEIFGNTAIAERVSMFLGNPNMLGIYLIIAFPIALGQIAVSRKIVSKIVYLIFAGLIMTCIVMTWSRGAWLGVIVATIAFLLLYDFKNIWIVLVSGLTLPLWQRFLPADILTRFTTIFTRGDSSIKMRFDIWETVGEIIGENWLTGIGVGETAFQNVYDSSQTVLARMAVHSHNLYLQILLEVGIIGIVVFAVIMLMFGQKSLIEIKHGNKTSKSRTMTAAGFSAIIGACVAGCTDYIWYNYRVFLMFWIVFALTVALSKANVRERESTRIISNMTSADLEISR